MTPPTTPRSTASATTWRVVTTVDFFTPIVDDPFDFGRIAAANALSDVYAMGGQPLTALNLVAYSLESLAAERCGRSSGAGPRWRAEAGVAIAGGHSIDDPSPSTAWRSPARCIPTAILRNSTAEPATTCGSPSRSAAG